MLSGLALTPLGLARLSELRPHTDVRRVEMALAATSEGVAYLADNSPFQLKAPGDLEMVLALLALEGRALEPRALLGLVDFLGSVEAARAAIRRAGRGPFPFLRSLVEGGSSFEREAADVRQKIDASGQVVDHASPELRMLRDRTRKLRSRLRGTLESYIRGKETAKYLQELLVTERNGRFVLVVKAEHRGAIPGIVHGSSTSGASLFLEPLSTVEINNDIVALEEQEAEEVRRILLALSDAFRRRATDLQRTLEVATELDVVQAKARLSNLVDGLAPELSGDGRLELRAARHPLLIQAIASKLHGESGEAPGERERPAPVPVDLLLVPPATVLVITGPNTGGKTVALKTAGLLALMAQAGLHVPAAAGSRLPVFRVIFADIGDEQSIEANLSTFSWHMTNIAAMDRALALPALVLLDEVGAGTDPAEGGALGQAIVDHFRTRGALVVATTHYDAVKSYAATTEGVTCAAFGFDPATFAPTYELTYGTPGRSLALEIASRLGIAPSVVRAAERARSAREAQLSEHLARLDHDRQGIEHDRRLIAREREQLTETDARLRAREEAIRQREESLRRRLDEQLDGRLREARREIDAIVEELKQRTAQLAADAARRVQTGAPVLSTGETGAARAEARAALESLSERFHQGDAMVAQRERAPALPAIVEPRESLAPIELTMGDRVAIVSLGVEGTIRAVLDHQADVEVRGKRMRVPLIELRLIAPGVAPRVSVNVHLQPRESFPSDLNVIGCTVDEALTRADKFLDEALVSEQRTVRVIHGHGTGQLRRALTDFLHSHPLVARIAPAPLEQGGSGVTVVELKD